MNSTARSSTGSKFTVSVLLAAVAFMALVFAADGAKAANAGGPIVPEFNYVGLFVGTTVAGDMDTLVYSPADGDPIAVNGEYTDSNGNFKVPKEGGLAFPSIVVDLDLLVIDGKISLTRDGTGHYDEATGEMSLDLSIALELGVDDLGALSNEVGIPLGTGQLACKFAPLDIEAGTGKSWPHPGKAFEDKANFKDGAIAGAWRAKPSAVAVKGDQSVCNIIGGFLKPVGGIWLANSTEPIDEMPPFPCPVPTSQSQLPCKGPPPKCPEGQIGHFPDCEEEKGACPPNMVGEWPDCVIVDPATELTKVTIGPKKPKVRAGKSSRLKIQVKARVGLDRGPFRIKLRSSNRQVKVPKSVLVYVKGSTTIVAIKLKATRKARGKATITASYPGLESVTKVTVKKAVKRKKKKK